MRKANATYRNGNHTWLATLPSAWACAPTKIQSHYQTLLFRKNWAFSHKIRQSVWATLCCDPTVRWAGLSGFRKIRLFTRKFRQSQCTVHRQPIKSRLDRVINLTKGLNRLYNSSQCGKSVGWEISIGHSAWGK